MNHDLTNARRGPVIADDNKTAVTVYLDNDVLARLRSEAESLGRGLQTQINSALRHEQFVLRGRYFADGPDGWFMTDSLPLARALVALYDKDDDWTVTDTTQTGAAP